MYQQRGVLNPGFRGLVSISSVLLPIDKNKCGGSPNSRVKKKTYTYLSLRVCSHSAAKRAAIVLLMLVQFEHVKQRAFSQI